MRHRYDVDRRSLSRLTLSYGSSPFQTSPASRYCRLGNPYCSMTKEAATVSHRTADMSACDGLIDAEDDHGRLTVMNVLSLVESCAQATHERIARSSGIYHLVSSSLDRLIPVWWYPYHVPCPDSRACAGVHIAATQMSAPYDGRQTRLESSK